MKTMTYREQFIWKRSVDLAVNCYEFTNHFPKSELYGLTSQIRRSSVSIASNIAEGYGRYIHEGRRKKKEKRTTHVLKRGIETRTFYTSLQAVSV
jgi:four helix bundle protein